MDTSNNRRTAAAGVIVAVEMFAVFESWGRPEVIFGGLPFKACRYTRRGRDIYVIRSGPGQENAARAAELAVSFFNVGELWNVGVAGGLTPGMRVGDVCIVADVVRWDSRGAGCILQTEMSPIRLSPIDDVIETAVHSAPELKRVRLASGDSVVAERRQRLDIAAGTGADIVDMEGCGLAEAAAQAGVPCRMIKCVSDDIMTEEKNLTAAFSETARAAFRAMDAMLE